MAEKKVFTGYNFQGGGQSKNLRLEARTDDPTNVGKGHLYFNTTSGKPKVATVDAGTETYATLLTTDSAIAATQVDLSAVDAITLDGYDSSTTAVDAKIPVYGTGGILPVGTPTDPTHATPKAYVDAAVQGLNVLEPCRLAQTHAGQFKTKGGSKDSTYANATPGTVTNTSVYNSTITADTNVVLSVDGVAVADGDRILVRWQGLSATATGDTTNSLAYENGIYDVTSKGVAGTSPWILTRARSGASATVIGDQPWKEYRNIEQINKGDFMFVTHGTENVNVGWVMTSNFDFTIDTARIGQQSISFTQFTGVGNITVTSNSAVAAPLVKLGNEIDFAYNTTRFGLTASALDVADGGIDTLQLATNSVTPLKLQDTGVFQMAGLGIGSDASPFGKLEVAQDVAFAATYNSQSDNIVLTRDATIGDNQYAGSIGFSPIDSPNERMVSIAGLQTAGDSNQMGLAIFTHPSASGATDIVEALRIEHDGRVAISSDATSPSGTLHVSTARYGSELITNGTMEATTNWGNYNSPTFNLRINAIRHSGSYSRKFSVDAEFEGIYSTPQHTVTAGKSYRVQAWVYADNTSTIHVQLLNGNGSSGTGTNQNATHSVTQDVWTKLDFTVGPVQTSGTASSITFQSPSGVTSGTWFIDDVSVKEDTLSANGTIPINGGADELILSNSSDAGMSIISSSTGEGRIYFGDKNGADSGRIIYLHASNKLQLNTNGVGTAGLEIDSSQNVYLPTGRLGVGTTAGNTALSVTQATNDQWAGLIAHTSTENGYGLLVKGGNASSNISLEVRDKDNANLFTVKGDGNASFPNGNLAIGGTTASDKLQIHAGGIQLDSGYQLSWGDTNNAIFGSSTADYVAIKTNGSDRFKIDTDGTQDHKGNATVNSASIQGLQDGAAYDFDGSSGYITHNEANVFPYSSGTISAWIKTSTAGTYKYIASSGDDSRNDYAIGLAVNDSNQPYIYYVNGSDTGIVYGTSNVADGEWHHVVGMSSGTAYSIYVDGVAEALTEATGGDNDGTWFSDIPNRDGIDIGRLRRQTTGVYWKGQIRDVKIFPSALAAADVRKLYSGENPKKNLNVEILTDGGFGTWSGSPSRPAGWDFLQEGSSTITQVTVGNDGNSPGTYGVAIAIDSSGNSAGIYTNTSAQNLTPGKTYMVSFYAKSLTGAPTVDVRTSDGDYTPNTVHQIHTLSTTWTKFTTVFTCPTGRSNLFINRSSATSLTYFIDDVTLQEVGTLVDFIPRSASTTKWFNQAIPSLYNGTLQGGVTLSAGSTDHRVENALDVGGTVTATAFDGTLGATTPSTVVATTLEASTPANKTTAVLINGTSGLAGVKARMGQFANGLYITNNYYYDSAQFNDSATFGQSSVLLTTGSAAASNKIDFSVSLAGATVPVKVATVSSTGLDVTGAITASTTLGVTGLSTLAAVTASGNVGIGTTAPAVELDVYGVSAFTENVTSTYGTAVVRGSEITPALAAKGILDIEQSGTIATQGSGATLTFSNNNWIYGRSFTRVGGAIKVAKTNTTNQNPQSDMVFSTTTIGSVLTEQMRLSSTGLAVTGSISSTTESTFSGGLYITGGTLKLDDIAESIDFLQSGAINFDSDNNQTGRVFSIGSGRGGGTTGGTTHLQITEDGTQDHQANRIVNSQTVSDLHRTAEPSLRFDGVDDHVNITGSLVTNRLKQDVTVSCWFKPTADNYGSYKRLWSIGKNGHRALQVYSTSGGTSTQVAFNSSTVCEVQSAKFETGRWYHLVVTYNGARVETYLDGVKGVGVAATGDLLQTYPVISIGHEENTAANSTNYNYAAEYKDFRIHNRALEDTEVAAIYNGESTPWKYADADPTNVLAGWSFLDSGWTTSGTTVNDANTFTSSSNTQWLRKAFNNSPGFTTGKRYRLRVAGTISTGNLDIKDRAVSNVLISGLTGTFDESIEFTAGETTNPTRDDDGIAFANADNTAVVDITALEYTLIGEVAAYTPQSIGASQWADTTSNGNTGQISGATRVNQTVHGGLILGNSDGILNTSKYSYIRRDTVDGTDDGLLAICGGGGRGATRGAYINLFGEDHASASAVHLIGTTHTHYVGADQKLKITAGAVKAASGALTNLKQVARTGTSTTVGLITGDASKTHFSITHGLGTELVVASIREKLTPFSFVEAEVRSGSWSDDSTMVANSQYDKITVIFATAPAANADFYCTVIG